MTKTFGILLAGGLSRRFGSPKAFAQLDGRYFYEVILDALADHCDDIIIVTRPELAAKFPVQLHVISDLEEFQGQGPLAGILSAMEAAAADRYIVCPCDMPFLNSEIIGKLLSYHAEGITAVRANGAHHPLVSVWSHEIKRKLRTSLEKQQLRVMKILSDNHAVWINGEALTDQASIVLRNVNERGDLEGIDEHGKHLR